MITDAQKKLLEYYNKGLELYKKREWDEALVFFQKAVEVVPGDTPSQKYIERCTEYSKTPPPDNWDGVFVMKTK